MEIKGTAVKSTQDFVKYKFPEKLDFWIDSLPKTSKIYFNTGVLASNWYPIIESALIPAEKVGEIFYNGNIEKAAFEVGKYSAMQALKGVYKIFVKVASIEFVMKRVRSIFTTYYSGGKFILTENNYKKFIFDVSGFKDGEELIFERITGWIQGLFEVISKNPYTVSYKIKKQGSDIEAKIYAIMN